MQRLARMPLGRLIGLLAKFAALILLIYAGSLASDWLTSRFVPHLTPSTEPFVHRMIMLAVLVYMVCMMLPFVPGMEIGLALMVVFGPPIVPLVYGATVLALSLSFLLGRLVPQSAIISSLESFQLNRLARLLAELQSLDHQIRLQWLLRNAPGRLAPLLLKFRYLAMVLLFNMPGNAVLGGGGGIAMTAGFSRIYSFGGFVAAVALAVSPVPLIIIFTGAFPS
ncbi:MAG: hypothetical protein V4747_08960 [Pseudomonadota bacterium]